MDVTNYIVKITLYKGYHPDKVVYYQYDFPCMLMLKYRWYFEYLAALVKVSYPHEKVELLIDQNSDGFLAGNDYIEKKTKSLLASLRSQLTRLEKGVVQDDLFGTMSKQNNEKRERVRKEIADLERGLFTRWVPPVYINKVKEVLNLK